MSEIYTASGRRKTAVARVTLQEGTGEIIINGEPFEEALPTLILQGTILEPLQLTSLRNKFDIKAYTRGGGSHGQADAIKLAISRALIQFDSELRPPLKAAMLLRRDPRARERKKPGQPGARKRFQFSKR
ncbi:30S ribosomal protein S9 [Akkermansiaceae bacterium]|nr:30S ribosomal protein S9 [Akkermansiaceae bacterium]